MPILTKIQPVNLIDTKNVLLSAIRFATSISGPCPPFGNELKTSAQEQVEYMLGEDNDTQFLTADEEVKAESLSDLDWMCSVLPKMDLMKDFVVNWAELSGNILRVVQDKKLESLMWGFKVKLMEVTAKVLEAVGYGTIIIPAPCRVQLLKAWLPFMRKMKPLLDSLGNEDDSFPYKMDEDLCQSIEGAIVSLILALPSNDQADILADWMKGEQARYPDLTEAFEVWCYRTKSAKRRLLECMERDGKDNATLALDLSQ
ncbi:BTB/POZ domain-containing protein At3g05675 isoform X2 [Diospyros lotus]|uniref:BTB/POZ domain-containing protein At3g05675 isoform X2 n=1 Tax=Diospyros lotus TaxID=55363 RepID=UPI00224E2944|nr:BTB/POZ domain-containing protein At3g05675 isoform X2 [Diospyros lotus]